MGVIRNIVIAVTTISFLTFVALFGQLPALRKTPIGWLHRLLRHRIPRFLAKADNHVTGGRVAAAGARLGDYLFYQQNPVVLIIFLVLLTGSATLLLWHTIPLLPARKIAPIPFVLIPPYLLTWLCAKHKGHHITPATHRSRLHDYPYDHVLFRPNHVCVTCHLAKPARSKHCNFCGVCIAMCDHHCPWVNNCVGRGNYRYFLALLLTLGLAEIYGAYISWWVLRPHLATNPMNPTFSRAYFDDLLRVAANAVNAGGLSIAGVGMLAATTGGLPLGLLVYHCYLIWAGMTTNESQKWADWREDIRDGNVFIASREDLDNHDGLPNYDEPELNHANGTTTHVSLKATVSDEPTIPWPKSSNQVLIYAPDSRPPPDEEALWSRLRTIRDVDNIYDLGWNNFVEVFMGR